MRLTVIIEESQEHLFAGMMNEVQGPVQITDWERTRDQAEEASRGWLREFTGKKNDISFKLVRRWTN